MSGAAILFGLFVAVFPMIDWSIAEWDQNKFEPWFSLASPAYALTEDRERCFAAGCDEYETKPFDFPRLLSKIRRLLQPAASPA